GLVRSHYIGRTFIEPSQAIRHFGVKLKLSAVREVLEGRRVVLIDDSIVRGTTSRKIVSMVREAGALEVHLRISCPPTIGPCYYGVDTPNHADLIASSHTVEEIRKHIAADSLAYLSHDGMMRAVGEKDGFCSACYTNRYPVQFPRQQSDQLLLPQPLSRRGGRRSKITEGGRLTRGAPAPAPPRSPPPSRRPATA